MSLYWILIPADIVEGSTVKGKIVNIEDYGAFLEIYPGVEGLIHVSEVNWNSQPINAKDFFFLGQEFEAKVGTIDREERKMSLSLKQLVEDPWTHVQQNFSVGTRHTGVVKNLTPYGVFVELSEGIGGMVHISDLSWTKRYNHPSEYTKVGQNLDVLITDIDLENRKLSLGHKQLEENPWDTFESIFPEGSYHEATVLRKDDRGFTVQLPYGLEAYAPVKFMKKENNLNAAVDETLTVKVIEFNREEKKIIVSHTRYLEDIRKEADDNVKKEKDVERQVTKKAVEKIQTKVEMSTLGEIEGFSQLKEQLQESAKAKLDAKAEAKANAAPAEVKVEATEKSPKNELFETSESEAEVKPKAKAKAKSTTGDDLKIIEGIGPKIAELLNADGINTFEELANAEISKIQTVLDNAGSRYRMHDPSTWPQQARLAFEGKMDELKVLQDSLKGGKA
jgi:small subunit ribosomal protein S1